MMAAPETVSSQKNYNLAEDEEGGHELEKVPKPNSRLHQYQDYQGFWYVPRFIPGVINCQAHFRAHPSDTLLVTSPKSGTTWLVSLLFAVVNRHRHPVATAADISNHPLTTHHPHEVVPSLEIKLFFENPDPDLSHVPSPRLFSSHLPANSLPPSVRDSNCKLVYLCRDPRDVFVSHWHFANADKPLADAFELFCQGVSLCGPFWDHVLGYWKESLHRPDNVLFLRYEEVKQDTAACVRRIADFLGCPFDDDNGVQVDTIVRLCSFDHLSKLEVNSDGDLVPGLKKKSFFRRGEVGDWANYLTPEMAQTLDRITQYKFRDSGLHF